MMEKGIKDKKTMLIKTLFLIKQELSPEKFYDFYPYQYGPFSNEIYHDIRRLEDNDIIDKDWDVKVLTESENKEFENVIKDILEKYNTADKIKKYVYTKYPEFVPKSIQKGKGITTIGYEGESIDFFLNKLLQNNIEIVVDVRNNPFSMKFDFIGNKLEKYLINVKIQYIQIKELGVESDKRKDIDIEENRKRLLSNYFDTLKNKEKYIKDLVELGNKQKIGLLCFEKDPIECHRGKISEYIQKNYNLMVENI